MPVWPLAAHQWGATGSRPRSPRNTRAATPEATGWPRIATLYDALAEAAPGPIVEVNRAVAHGRAYDADAGLAVLDAIPADALRGSHLLPAVRGDLLERSGRNAEAAASFREAAAVTGNAAERALLERRAGQNDPQTGSADSTSS